MKTPVVVWGLLLSPAVAGAQDLGGFGPQEAAKSKITLKQAIMLPSTLQKTVLETGASCLQAVSAASALGGGGQQLVKTGMLKQSAEKKSEWTYSSSPEDRLRAVFANGKTVEFVVHTIEGTFDQGIKGFAENNHRLDFTVRSDDGELRLSGTRQGDNTLMTLKGRWTVEGTEYTLDVTTQEGKVGKEFEADVKGGIEGHSIYGGYSNKTFLVTGTIQAPGFSLKVQEQLQMEHASHESKSASRHVRWLKSAFSLDGVSYELNGMIQKSFTDGSEGMGPARRENEWTPRGGLLREGKEFGSFRFLKPNMERDRIQIVLETPAERIILEEVDGRW